MKEYKLNNFSLSADIDFKKNLNPQQLKVIEQADGAALVLAGAGSGKTRVLTYRVAWLLEKGIDPKNILIVTFTNKAAAEMIHRTEALMKKSLPSLWAGTFHHIANIILRKESEFIGYSPNYTIIDKEDSKDLIFDCIEELGFSRNQKLFPKKNIISRVWSLAVNSLTDIDEIIKEYFPHIRDFSPQIKKVINLYIKKKKESQSMDFDDILLNWLKLLKNEAIREKYASSFHYVLVDEYQDTNRIQYEILKRISSVHNNILAVGDDAQSIYSFRAADINNLLSFPDTFEKARIFKLETNYRSTPQVLDLANEIIKHNVSQFPKKLKAVNKDDILPVVVKTRDVYAQAKFICQRVADLSREGLGLHRIAILFRSRFQALELEVELLKQNIPYLIRGGLRFFEQAHIKDILSYFKYINNPHDELAFKRALCLHSGIGRGYAQKIWQKLAAQKLNPQAVSQSLPAKQKQSFSSFIRIIDNIKKSASTEEAINSVMSFYKDYCYLSFDNTEDRIADLEELTKMAASFPSIQNFLLDISSFEEFKGESALSGTGQEETLVLSTIHQAKGLEWNVVFLLGFNDYDFPNPRALEKIESLEEERRLFYVATTRAKKEFYMVYPQSKHTNKNGLVITRASMFLYELPAHCYQEWEVVQDNTYL